MGKPSPEPASSSHLQSRHEESVMFDERLRKAEGEWHAAKGFETEPEKRRQFENALAERNRKSAEIERTEKKALGKPIVAPSS